jgi:hypothetical protein
MVTSHTRKKSSKLKNTQLREVSNVASDYIKQWTTRELGKLQTDKNSSPICIPVKNGYKIGLYQLTVFPNKTCDVRDSTDTLIHRFDNKISAILYTIYTIKRQFKTANDILVCDKEINKCYTDMLALRSTIERARQRQDYVTVDTRMPRLELAETRLTLARDKISKIHKTAKYNKVWL